MAKRTFPDLGPREAYARLRGNILDALQARTQQGLQHEGCMSNAPLCTCYLCALPAPGGESGVT